LVYRPDFTEIINFLVLLETFSVAGAQFAHPVSGVQLTFVFSDPAEAGSLLFEHVKCEEVSGRI
jgi:hypothetical protein